MWKYKVYRISIDRHCFVIPLGNGYSQYKIFSNWHVDDFNWNNYKLVEIKYRINVQI